jgi:hypothetical protein
LLLFAGGESIARASRRREIDRAVRQSASDRILADSLHFILECPQGIIPAEIDLIELDAADSTRSAEIVHITRWCRQNPVACPAVATRQCDARQIFIRDHAHARTRLSIAGGCRQTGPATPGPRHRRHRRSGIHRHRGAIIDHDVGGVLRADRSAKAGEPRHRASTTRGAGPAPRP